MRKILLLIICSVIILSFGTSVFADFAPFNDSEVGSPVQQLLVDTEGEEIFNVPARFYGDFSDSPLDTFSAFSWIILIAVLALFVLPIYIYVSLVYMGLAKKIGTTPAWLAWIPIANLYLISKMAQKHWWPMLLIFTFIVPVVNVVSLMILVVCMFFWHCRIFERVKRPAWWAVTSLIPGFGSIVFLVLLGVAAWKDPEETN